MSVSCTKLNNLVDQIARPVAVYLAVLCTFWVVHYPLIWLGFAACGVEKPGQDPGFHRFVDMSRLIIDAPIYPFYRLPYWLTEGLLGMPHINYLWLKTLFLIFSVYAIVHIIALPVTLLVKIYQFFHRFFTGGEG